MALAGQEGEVLGPGLPTDAAVSDTLPKGTLLWGRGIGAGKGQPPRKSGQQPYPTAYYQVSYLKFNKTMRQDSQANAQEPTTLLLESRLSRMRHT